MSTKMLVAVAGCRREAQSGPGDLYPDPDVAPLRAALGSLGVESRWVSWDDASIEWGNLDRVLISGTWDSVDRPGEYLNWARQVALVSTLVNGAGFLEWNINKRYLRDLAAAGLPTVPTDWVEPGRSWEPPPFDFVIKPSISAGGRSTASYRGGDPSAAGHMGRLHTADQTAMVQPHLESMTSEGEVDLVFLGGQLSHAFRRRLPMEMGAGVLDRPWERIQVDGLLRPTPEQIALGRLMMEALQALFGRLPHYARVDLVRGPGGSSLLTELELIDPYLGFDLAPGEAHRLARTVSATE
jgi:hypothetical protein